MQNGEKNSPAAEQGMKIMYVKILSGADERFTSEMFYKIEVATTKNRPFDSGMYYLFSLRPADAQMQKILEFDNAIVADADPFFTRDDIQFFEKVGLLSAQ